MNMCFGSPSPKIPTKPHFAHLHKQQALGKTTFRHTCVLDLYYTMALARLLFSVLKFNAFRKAAAPQLTMVSKDSWYTGCGSVYRAKQAEEIFLHERHVLLFSFPALLL